jgi:16S rRNA (guanine966-N2)-methyltransferase
MREGLFSALASIEGALDGYRFLDLYAGSGAVGIEAWSRGADHVLAVEQDQRAVQVIRRNAETVGADGAVVVRGCTVDRLATTKPSGSPYDIVFVDPPYEVAAGHVADVLTALHQRGWFGQRALLVVERATRKDFTWPIWAEPEKSRSYGEATLWYARAGRQPATDGPGGTESLDVQPADQPNER